MSRLNSEQIGAIIFAAILGRRLQKEMPRIAELYRKGFIYRNIMIQFGIYYMASENVAISAVEKAIRGYDGWFNVKSYNGLIHDSELEELSKEHKYSHQKNIASIGGVESGRNGIGVRRMHELGYGFENKTSEEQREYGRKGAIARGQVFWEEKEIEFVYKLSKLCEYKWGKMISNAKIAGKLNAFYHKGRNVRSAMAVKRVLDKHRGKIS